MSSTTEPDGVFTVTHIFTRQNGLWRAALTQISGITEPAGSRGSRYGGGIKWVDP